MTIHVVPIEPLDKRYTAQWIDWFDEDLTACNARDAIWYLPPSDPDIKRGQFLDVVNTNKFKAKQLEQLCDSFNRGNIKDGDVIFFFDLWFPGIEMLFYIRDGLGIDFKIAGVLHAGTWDPFDFLTQKGMKRWAEKMERTWFAEVDAIFLAVDFHKKLLKSRLTRDNAIITGLPLKFVPRKEEKENIIVFPHRLAPEKQPNLFDDMQEALQDELRGWSFVRTQSQPRTKEEYYSLLARSKVVVSFSQQETWGIGMLEAMFYGCVPVAPRRLAYPETMPTNCLYDSFMDACNLVVDAALDYEEQSAKIKGWRDEQILWCDGAIGRMVEFMRGKGWNL